MSVSEVCSGRVVGECLSFGEDLHCGCCCRVWTATAVLSGVGLVLQIRICLITWCNLLEFANSGDEDRPGHVRQILQSMERREKNGTTTLHDLGMLQLAKSTTAATH